MAARRGRNDRDCGASGSGRQRARECEGAAARPRECEGASTSASARAQALFGSRAIKPRKPKTLYDMAATFLLLSLKENEEYLANVPKKEICNISEAIYKRNLQNFIIVDTNDRETCEDITCYREMFLTEAEERATAGKVAFLMPRLEHCHDFFSEYKCEIQKAFLSFTFPCDTACPDFHDIYKGFVLLSEFGLYLVKERQGHRVHQVLDWFNTKKLRDYLECNGGMRCMLKKALEDCRKETSDAYGVSDECRDRLFAGYD